MGEHPLTARQARREATLDRTVDRLIAEENRAFLADPQAIADAQAEGDLYRQRGEAEGWLPVEDRIMRPSPGFRYDDSDIPQDERDLGQWDLDHND
jgi:hypothetical protein